MTISIDELSRMAGERWAREDEKKRCRPGPDRKPKSEPGRARPGHGASYARNGTTGKRPTKGRESL
jgi:hypothetical protein